MMLTSRLLNLRCMCFQKALTKFAVSNYEQRLFSSKLPNQPVQTQADGKPKKVKKPEIPKITLLSTEDDISVTTLEEAQQLSKRRDLKLVKLIDIDTKTQRPVYKLMTGTQYYAEEIKQKEIRKQDRQKTGSVKGDKLVFINSHISQHDLDIHLNKIVKWISKKYQVRVVINGTAASADKTESITKFIEDSVKDSSKVTQKQKKGQDFKFCIIPNLEETDTKSS